MHTRAENCLEDLTNRSFIEVEIPKMADNEIHTKSLVAWWVFKQISGIFCGFGVVVTIESKLTSYIFR